MANKDWFKIQLPTLRTAMSSLVTDEERGRLLLMIYNYQEQQPLFNEDEKLNFIFRLFEQDFVTEEKNRKRVSQIRSDAKKRYWDEINTNKAQLSSAASNQGEQGEHKPTPRANAMRLPTPPQTQEETPVPQAPPSELRSDAIPPDGQGQETDAPTPQPSYENLTYSAAKVGDILVMNGKRVVKRQNGVFIIPTIDEVAEYINEKDYHFLPKAFLEYYENSRPHPWCMANGKPVKAWKQCCTTFENHVFLSEGRRAVNQQQKQQSHAHNNINEKDYELF